MKKYVCDLCGYIYDEAAGDPENGVAPGTKWEDVPEDWVCPLCGADKSQLRRGQEPVLRGLKHQEPEAIASGS